MAAKPQLCRRHYGLRTIVLLRRRCEARMCGWMCAEHFAKQNVRKNVVVCKNAFLQRTDTMLTTMLTTIILLSLYKVKYKKLKKTLRKKVMKKKGFIFLILIHKN